MGNSKLGEVGDLIKALLQCVAMLSLEARLDSKAPNTTDA
jgi:hypothetical protein